MVQVTSADMPADKDKDGDKSFLELVRSYFRYYCDRSTIHCVRYLYDVQLHNMERLIWGVLLVTSVTLCCSFYMLLSERYGAQKLQTVIEDSQYPVFHVQFPAVGVCTENRVNWSKLEAAKAQFLPANASEDVVEAFVTLVKYMTMLRFDNFEFSTSEMEDTNFEIVDFVSLISLANFLVLRCEDILVPDSCQWRQTSFNCCDYFLLEKTEYGLCLVFNSELSYRSQMLVKREGPAFYPKHNAKAGQSSGLNFNLLLNDSFKSPDSRVTDNVFIMIKPPTQMTNVVYSIRPNTETHVAVRPQRTRTDYNTRNIPPKRRNCYFEDEEIDFGMSRLNKSALISNCRTNCHESYLVRLCNCSLPIFFARNEKVRNCTASSLRCISRHNDIFSYDKHLEEDSYFTASKPGMSCPCLVSCDLLEYFTSTTTLPLSPMELPASSALKVFKVDVHYQVDMMITYRTSLEFTSIDLIANLGGIFGLCLGASMVSGVELIYFLTVGFAVYLYDNNYYAILRKNLQNKWTMGLRYLRNEVSHTRQEAHPADPKLKSKLRHPFSSRANVW
ncbi:PREDICTED: pickpocket protein 19 [Drosophila arizonae]|uniref:Pickpocket protein 19 n=1 Tax=Drosophila arizonae TaxID=7263 RepID=A0ABM1NUX0_DROAR|nr:PREDICTED: pickpocket protein 19 [Drosophila arizonae]